MAHKFRSSSRPNPIPRLVNQLEANDTEMARLQMDPNARNRHVRCSNEMDGFMLASLVEQVLSGHKRSDNGFTSFQVSKAMERVVNGCGVTVTEKNVRARLKTLKKEYGEVRQLLNMSGFGLDPELGRIVADAGAWEDFIKQGKLEFGKWKMKLYPRYEDMETIFGNDGATGERAVSGFDHFSPMNVTTESVNELEEENVEVDVSPMNARKCTSEEGSNRGKRRRRTQVDESNVALLRIAYSSSKIANAMEIQATLDAQNHVNWQLVLEKLESMDLDMNDIIEVMQAFRLYDGLAKVFMSLTSTKYMRALVFRKLGRDVPLDP